jgi:hypothetical protein
MHHSFRKKKGREWTGVFSQKGWLSVHCLMSWASFLRDEQSPIIYQITTRRAKTVKWPDAN